MKSTSDAFEAPIDLQSYAKLDPFQRSPWIPINSGQFYIVVVVSVRHEYLFQDKCNQMGIYLAPKLLNKRSFSTQFYPSNRPYPDKATPCHPPKERKTAILQHRSLDSSFCHRITDIMPRGVETRNVTRYPVQKRIIFVKSVDKCQ